MRAAYYTQHGGPERLKVGDWPGDPLEHDGHVLVRVRAVALNGFDPMMLAGSTGLRVPMPMVPCGDFAGEVLTVPDHAHDKWQPGDRVCGYPMLPDLGMLGEVTPGAAREVLSVPAESLIAVPDNVTFAQAAALPVAYGTALRMMYTRGAVKAGERVLILGATGGVGVACVQLAKARGASVVACGRGPRSRRLLDIGADEIIDTAEHDVYLAVRERFGKPDYAGKGDGGFDVVVNYIGGDTWTAGLKLVRQGGRVLVCGATAGHDPQTDLRYVWSFEQNIVGSNGWTMDDQRELLAMTAEGVLAPVFDEPRPIDDIAEVMSDLIERRIFGKAVLTL
ncbi:MAG: zinc-binding dehydrogenase [Pseudomonadota bacterium]